MARKKTPPEYGESEGPMMVACQWNRSSPIGPAEHDDGGSRPKSVSSLLILFNAIATVVCVVFGGLESGCGCSSREVLEGAANGKKFWVLEFSVVRAAQSMVRLDGMRCRYRRRGVVVVVVAEEVQRTRRGFPFLSWLVLEGNFVDDWRGRREEWWWCRWCRWC